jgi:hypothetical protein
MSNRSKTRRRSQELRLEAKLQDSCLQMLMPLAGILLRAGIGAGEFSNLCRKAYVHVAASQLTTPGRRPNASRIAVATGLTRQEVARLLKGDDNLSGRVLKQLHRANRVLAGWYTDSRYSLKPGEPKPIPIRGSGLSFQKLVRKYGGDVPPRAVLDELRRAAAVRSIASGALVPTRRFVEYGAKSQLALRNVSGKLQLLAETLRHNLDYPTATLFEGVAMNNRLRGDHYPIAVRRLSSSAKRFLSATREYLGRDERQQAKFNQHTDPLTLGLGIFLFGKSPQSL